MTSVARRPSPAASIDAPTDDMLRANARALVAEIRARASKAEALRRIPDATIAAIRDAGLFRILQPARWGGYERDVQLFLDIAMDIASACGSTGWVYSVLGVHNWHLALFDERAQADVWGKDRDTLTASAYSPLGEVRAVEGGFHLDGTWRISSGCHHGAWALLGGIVQESAGQQYYTFLVPRADFEIIDCWHVAGLAATGSNNLRVQNAFVPDYRAHAMPARGIGGPGADVNPGALYRYPFPSVLTNSITAPMLGMAKGAIDAHIELMRGRKRAAYGGEAAAMNGFAQKHVADATAMIDAATLQMRTNLTEMAASIASGVEIARELRLRLRRDQTRGSVAAIDATNLVFANSGGAAILLSNPIQRAWRDVNAARVHAANEVERLAAAYGGEQLGIPTTETSLF